MTSTPAALRAALLQKEASAALGVSVRTLLNWRKAGYGPQPTWDGGRWLYDRAEIDAHLAGVR